MSSNGTVYLVTGANRGIGLGLVKQIISDHADSFVYAGVRNPDAAFDLIKLQQANTGRLSIVNLTSNDITGNKEAAREIEAVHGCLDTIIANAGIANVYDTVDKIDPRAFEEHLHVNVTGTIVLFQAFVPLLRKSASPRFITMSSSAGRLSSLIVETDYGNVAYGSSKAALNWVTRKIHFENGWLTAFPMCPGPVMTDMQRTYVANTSGGETPEYHGNLVTPENASSRLLKIIDTSTRDVQGGEFIFINGDKLEW